MNHFWKTGLQALKKAPILAACAVVGIVTALLLVVLAFQAGVSFTLPTAMASASQSGIAENQVFFRLLIALIAIMVVARGLGNLMHWFHQPPVIGEILAGIAIGPSLLGAVSPAAYEYLLPPEVSPYLGIVAQLGIVLYMFTVGLKFDLGLLHRRGHAAVAISHASILAPLLLAAVVAVPLYPYLSDEKVPFVVFALFFGVAMSVTAFPVLARILADRGIDKSPLGAVALTCAAVDDVTAWCLLALVAGIAQAQLSAVATVFALSLLYIGVMLLVVRPIIRQWLSKLPSQTSSGPLAIALIGLFVSAALTEHIGIHAIFGAFLWGAIIPPESALARTLHSKLEEIVGIVLLPAFFAFAGMRTRIGLISGLPDLLLCGLIIAIASVGKIGGSALAARVSGMSWRDSSAIGILMNTRGLMELIVLNVGLDLGVISPRLYALMVVMALVTTAITTPGLHLLGIRRKVLTEGGSQATLRSQNIGETAMCPGDFHGLANGKL